MVVAVVWLAVVGVAVAVTAAVVGVAVAVTAAAMTVAVAVVVLVAKSVQFFSFFSVSSI